MKKSNYHMHTTISDGKLEPEELINLAIKKKFTLIGITDHYHFPPNFREEKNEFYSGSDYKELFRLKAKYKPKIKILVGVEFDWLADYAKWFGKEAKKKYDYKLLSMHFIKVGEDYVPLDLSEDFFKEIVKKSDGIKKVVESYYRDLRKGVKTGYFDVVAHLDIIKIWNKGKKYFSGNEDWYKKQVEETLDLIKDKNMKIEINAAGWRKPCNEQYPSKQIIKDALKLKIPILIGTDCHKKEDIDNRLNRANNLLKRLR